jgi:hypothetical protein
MEESVFVGVAGLFDVDFGERFDDLNLAQCYYKYVNAWPRYVYLGISGVPFRTWISGLHIG